MSVVIATQFKFKCPLCGWSITLPRRSQLGAYVDEKYHPISASWPIKWICIPHEHVCDCTFDRVELIKFEEQPRVESPASLWEIEPPCSQGSCQMVFQGYTLWDLSEASRVGLIDSITKANPKVTCSAGHEIIWQSEKIKATMLPF